MTDNDLPFALPPGFVIDKYRIERVLGYGGFSVVYEAAHTRLTNRRVAIKEYLPQNWFTRDGATMRVRPLSEYGADYEAGLRRFLDEANHLADIDHPNVIDCLDYLEGNGTAYLVMKHESGLSLNELLRMREGRGEPFDEEDIMKIVMPALDGLATAHDRDVLHRDLKPDNIFVRRADERPLLIDFGGAKSRFSAGKATSFKVYTNGYAPMEQVQSDGRAGPYTDIYAVGATMWRMMNNRPRPDENGEPTLHPPMVEDRAFAVYAGKPDPLVSAAELAAGRFSP